MVKIEILTDTIIREKEIKHVTRYCHVPNWVWPFDCDYCLYGLDEEMQIVAEVDRQVKHFHQKCWNKIAINE